HVLPFVSAPGDRGTLPASASPSDIDSLGGRAAGHSFHLHLADHSLRISNNSVLENIWYCSRASRTSCQEGTASPTLANAARTEATTFARHSLGRFGGGP